MTSMTLSDGREQSDDDQDVNPTEGFGDLRTRPLTGREQSNLEKIVRGDFETAYGSIDTDAAKFEHDETTRINAKYLVPDAKLTELARRSRELQERLRQEVDTFLAEIATEGFTPSKARGGYAQTITIGVPTEFAKEGRDDEMGAMKRQVSLAREVARNTLQQQRTDATRKILLAGISTDAATELLAGLPKPGEALRSAIEATRADG